MAKSTRRKFVKDFGKVAAFGGLIRTGNIRISGEDNNSSMEVFSRLPLNSEILREGGLI